MFFEPSTRTRISFGASFNLLGGNVREITEVSSSSLAKGESLVDTAKVLSGYSDVIVMRHPEEGSVQRFAEASRVPVINGGDGSNEPPSQALLDLFTIRFSSFITFKFLSKWIFVNTYIFHSDNNCFMYISSFCSRCNYQIIAIPISWHGYSFIFSMLWD